MEILENQYMVRPGQQATWQVEGKPHSLVVKEGRRTACQLLRSVGEILDGCVSQSCKNCWVPNFYSRFYRQQVVNTTQKNNI